MRGEVALFTVFPKLERAIAWARLGDWPTPIERVRLAGWDDLWVKRDDLSAEAYGGNKVRTLEALFGLARARGAARIWATGAYGSNHALATCLHARRVGLEPGVMLFPQPYSAGAAENLRATLAQRPVVRPLLSWATLPLAVLRQRRPESYVMVPGGATEEGALGYISAVLELAAQIAAGALPAPRRIVLGVGSTCTSAGLLAGLAIAHRLGLPGADPDCEVWAVRVTPWPVTSAWRIVSLATRAAQLVARLTGDARLAIPRRELAARLRVVGGHIGRGYGHTTTGGLAAIAAFAAADGPPLDTCYSGKAAAGLIATRAAGPTLFWATKSSRPLPESTAAAELNGPAVPRAMRRWLEHGAVST